MSVLFAVISGMAAALMLAGPHLDWTRRRLALQYAGDNKRIRAHIQLMRISGATLGAVCVVSVLRGVLGHA